MLWGKASFATTTACLPFTHSTPRSLGSGAEEKKQGKASQKLLSASPPNPAPYLRSVLSAREIAGFLTALLQAALLLRRENSLGEFGDILILPRATHTPEPNPGTLEQVLLQQAPPINKKGGTQLLHSLPDNTALGEFLH